MPYTIWRSPGAVMIRTDDGTITLTSEEAVALGGELGAKPRRFKWTPADHETLRRLYGEGKSVEGIARLLGASKGAVDAQITRLNIADRNTANRDRLRAVHAARKVA